MQRDKSGEREESGVYVRQRHILVPSGVGTIDLHLNMHLTEEELPQQQEKPLLAI
ncbi:hypothetical protein LINPERPRIM_LOCUS35242 [Linum perenne]